MNSVLFITSWLYNCKLQSDDKKKEKRKPCDKCVSLYNYGTNIYIIEQATQNGINKEYITSYYCTELKVYTSKHALLLLGGMTYRIIYFQSKLFSHSKINSRYKL